MPQIKPNKPLVSVIIPHLNQQAALEACLHSLYAQTVERTFEIIVVDNGSASSLTPMVARNPNVLFLSELQPGPGMARNRGIKASTGEILAFIDADCLAHPDWLKAALNALECVPDRTILGGDVQIWRDSNGGVTALEAYESVFAYRFQLYIEKHGFSGTGNLVVRRREFFKIGPFRGIDVAEDIDWGQRARAAGYSFLYVPEMIVFHPARRSLEELFVKWDRHIQHALNTGRSGRSMWRINWVLRAFAILASPLADWTKVLTSNRVHGASARIKAIYVLSVVRAYRAYRMLYLLFSNGRVIWNRDSTIVRP